MLERQWLGWGERHLRLSNGRWVSLAVEPADRGEHKLQLLDVTCHEVLERAVEQRRRMRALSELAGSLSRELTDPMAIVQGRLELLLDLGVSDPDAVRRHLEVALEHARRASATLRNLRLVGRVTPSSSSCVQFAEVVREALELVGPRRDQLVLKTEPEDLTIGCEGSLPARVLASLVRSCMDALGRAPVQLSATRSGTRVEVRIGPSGRVGGEEIEPWEDLSLHRTLLASVGGEIEVHRTGGISEFVVRLPTPSEPRVRRRAVHGQLVVVGAMACRVVPEVLSRDGYQFIRAGTAAEALGCLQDHVADALITDLLLDGGVSGLSLAEAVLRRHAERLPRLVLVGEGVLPTLPTPFVGVSAPLVRADLLEALGTRVRR
jgi:hypothetical protein